MLALSIPTGFRTTESLDVAVGLANARQGASDGDTRLEFHRRGLFTQDLQDEYPLVRDVPIEIVRDRVAFARAAEARKASEVPTRPSATSALVAAVKAAAAAPVVEPKVEAPRRVLPARPAAPSVRVREPEAIPADHAKCCSPGCQRHDLHRRMRVKPLKLIEAELGRLPTEAELLERVYCQPCYPHTMRVSYALSDTLSMLRRKSRDEGRSRQSSGFGTMAAAFKGVKLGR